MPKKRSKICPTADACLLRPGKRGRVKVRGLGDTTWGPYPTLAAHFYVGLDKGVDAKNRTGWCGTQPKKFAPKDADARFVAYRELAMEVANLGRDPDKRLTAKQLRDLFGASRVSQAGWFKSKPEKSHRYTVFYGGGDVPGEETPERFAASMRMIADKVSASLCQDEVVLAFESPSGNTGEGHVGEPDDYRRAAGMFRGRR